MELQTVLISKKIAKTPTQAELIASEKGFKSGTAKMGFNAWRIQQRPIEDFKEYGFKTSNMNPYIKLVHGELK